MISGRSLRRTSVAFERVATARIGRVLRGKWELVRVLGVGGMATVYEARHRNGARVALKMLHPALSASQTLCERFVREGYVANLVGHPRIPKVLDDDVDDVDGSAFLVMEMIEGVTLEERAQTCTPSDREILRIARDVLEILAVAHDKGVIHRDIKPDNLIIDGAGRVRVLDFGIARLLEDEDVTTTTGAPFGTPGYISPEQALGRRDLVGPATDIYLLGATLFTLASGEFVHASEHAQELVVAAATRHARSVGTCARQLSPEVVALIDRATKFDPTKRFVSARAMLREVERIEALLAERASSVRPPSSLPLAVSAGSRRAKRSELRALLATAAVAMAVGAVGFVGGLGRMKKATADDRPTSAAASRAKSTLDPTVEPSSPDVMAIGDDQPAVVVGEPKPISSPASAAASTHPSPSHAATPMKKTHKKRVIDVGY